MSCFLNLSDDMDRYILALSGLEELMLTARDFHGEQIANVGVILSIVIEDMRRCNEQHFAQWKKEQEAAKK